MTGKKKALLKSKKADGKGWGSEIDFIFVRREREREREKVDKNEGILRIIERERESPKEEWSPMSSGQTYQKPRFN